MVKSETKTYKVYTNALGGEKDDAVINGTLLRAIMSLSIKSYQKVATPTSPT